MNASLKSVGSFTEEHEPRKFKVCILKYEKMSRPILKPRIDPNDETFSKFYEARRLLLSGQSYKHGVNVPPVTFMTTLIQDLPHQSSPASATRECTIVLERRSKRAKKRNEQTNSDADSEDDSQDDSQEDSEDHSFLDYGKARRQLLRSVAYRLEREQERVIRDPVFRDEHNLDLQQKVRGALLRDHDKEAAPRLIPWHQQHDVNAFPARLSVVGDERQKGRKVAFKYTEKQNRRLRMYANERMKHAEPAYLAPWQQSSWMDGDEMKEGIKAEVGDGTSSASQFGNCLVSFQCRCKVCLGSVSPNWWVLHPIGHLLEKIRLSQFATSGGREVWRGTKLASTRGINVTAVKGREGVQGRPLPLDTGDTVLEMKQCGDQLFIARGSSYCTLFRVVVVDLTNSSPSDETCFGGSQVLFQVARLDFRCFIRGSLSYRPRSIVCHPRFGADFLDAKVAVALELEGGNVCNSIREYMVGDEIRPTEHTIRNLQLISDMQYSSSHPMVLWASARSYIKPLPAPERAGAVPKVGFGTSLFSIDLRNDEATFQWSPSASEFGTDGIHSISSVMTDWDRENAAFLSSISAKQTWELDMRMPCRPVCIWSLPHYGEGTGAEHDEFGVFGAGMIFARPKCSHGRGYPIFAVNKSRGTTGMHLYQRPNRAPNFQCFPGESGFTPAVSSSPVSVAAGMLFPLPDAAGSVFTCGLTSFRVLTRELLPSTDSVDEQTILDHAQTTVCVVSSTNKGDVYVQALLESKSEYLLATYCDCAPLRSTRVAATSERSILDREAPHNWLPVTLSNEYPVPSSAIANPLEEQKRTAKKTRIPWTAEFEDRDNTVGIQPGGALPMAPSKGAGQSVKLDSGFVDARSRTVNCFNNRLRHAQRWEIGRDKNFERTDLTEVFEHAELDWGRGYNTESEDDRVYC